MSNFEQFANQPYQYGFTTDIETDAFPPGLNESVIRAISEKKQEPAFMLEYRLKAFRHWQTCANPLGPP